jgi:hypothetical protein
MRYVAVALLTWALVGFAASSWAVEQSPFHPPILTPAQAKALYPWAYGIKTRQVPKDQKAAIKLGQKLLASGFKASKVPMDQTVPVGLARNLADDGQDRTLEALRHGNLPPIREQWGMDNVSRRGQGHVDWASDVLVRSGSVPTFGKLSMDHSVDGHVFVALYDPANAPTDTIFHYVSLNNGATWAEWPYPIAGDGSIGRLSDVEVRVGDETPTPWIYTFALYQSGSVSGLWCRSLLEDGSSFLWTEIAAGGDTISQVSADRDNNPPYYIYTTYKGNGGNLFGIRSPDDNATWDTFTYITGSANTHSEMAMGTSGPFYVTYQVDTTTIRIGRNDSYLGGSWVFNDIVGQGVSEWWPTIAASRTQAPASQTAWVVFRNNHGGTAIDGHYGYSTDGGATWTAQVWPPTNYYSSATPNYPHIRVGYDYAYDINSVVCPIYISSFDSLIMTYAAASDPTNWVARQIVNEHGQTGEFGPKIDLTNGMGGPGIAYREYGADRVWFDYWFNTSGVEIGTGNMTPNGGFLLAEARPNPVSRTTSIAFSLPKSGNVELAVYDIAGRKVATLAKGQMSAGSHEVNWNGANAPAGVYLYRLSFGGRTLTNRMVVIK